MKIAFLGPAGTFSEEAARKYCSAFGKREYVSYETIFAAVAAADSGKTDEVCVPAENSIEGVVNQTMDAVLFDASLYIKAQVNLPVSQTLFKKTDSEKIERIISHPHALAQCAAFLRKNYPTAELVPVNSTAEAAQICAKEKNIAGIGTKLAAKIYELKVIAENIQDNKRNFTSFLVLSKQNTAVPQKGLRTTTAFSIKNRPGELYKILDIFALWDLNMTKIQSRPMRGKPGEYIFFVDIDENSNPDDVNDAFRMIGRKAESFRCLGCYPLLETNY